MNSRNSLIDSLKDPSRYPHSVSDLRVIETHISWVILTGAYAYKIKKPVNLGFLDFSTLEQRRRYCEEELRINQPLAPQVYLEVVPIRDSERGAVFEGDGPIIDYAVKMREFPQTVRMDKMLSDDRIDEDTLDALAIEIARFHSNAASVAPDAAYGTSDVVLEPVWENFRQIAPLLTTEEDRASLAVIKDWTETASARLGERLSQRKRDGYVRDCHGDLHLANVAWIDNAPVLFDRIEFNPKLRWIDVISDTAFMVMDLLYRRRGDLASRFLNRYLEVTGDYAALALLRFYVIYRALVRCKVECIRQHQQGGSHQDTPAYRGYLQLAQRLVHPHVTPLIITHGLSGSGKTSVSGWLCERLPLVRLRSDVERKRLFGMAALARPAAELGGGIYSAQATEQTYGKLVSLADAILQAGFGVIVDAAFLKQPQRDMFAALAERRGVPFLIIDCHSPAEVLRARLRSRNQQGADASDAGLAVFEQQLNSTEPMSAMEYQRVLAIDTSKGDEALQNLLQRLRYAVCGSTPCY
jgi:aminoglycoside phosphotransferase family enzyme/predicted kinase